MYHSRSAWEVYTEAPKVLYLHMACYINHYELTIHLLQCNTNILHWLQFCTSAGGLADHFDTSSNTVNSKTLDYLLEVLYGLTCGDKLWEETSFLH